jgi:amino acid permease
MLPSYNSSLTSDPQLHANASETTSLLSLSSTALPSSEQANGSYNGNHIPSQAHNDTLFTSSTSSRLLASSASPPPSFVRQVSRHVKRLINQHVGKIGTLGSVSIAVNSLTGPAMLNLPATFARSGILPTLGCLVFVCILSAFCCLHMTNTISKVPGNDSFIKEVEYSEAFRYFWGRQWFLVTQGLFFCCITCLNISSIVDVAQVIDTFCGHWMQTHALQISTLTSVRWIVWDYSVCSPTQVHDGLCLPFLAEAKEGILVTMGNLIASALILPLALLDLKENAWWQVIGFIILLITSLQFVIQFATTPDISLKNTSWWGDNWDDLFGVVVFNFALVIAIPAWLYEREPHVQVAQVIHFSSILSTVLYISVGLLGCLAMPHVADNMLESMMSGAYGTSMQLGSSIFALAIIGLGSPLFSVLARLNLTGSGLCSQKQANILAVFFPHIVSWFLNDGDAVTKLLSWGGIVFTAMVAFILPILLAIHAVQEYAGKGSIAVYSGWFTSHQSELRSLYVLLVLTLLAVALAILGNLTDGPRDKENY